MGKDLWVEIEPVLTQNFIRFGIIFFFTKVVTQFRETIVQMVGNFFSSVTVSSKQFLKLLISVLVRFSFLTSLIKFNFPFSVVRVWIQVRLIVHSIAPNVVEKLTFKCCIDCAVRFHIRCYSIIKSSGFIFDPFLTYEYFCRS